MIRKFFVIAFLLVSCASPFAGAADPASKPNVLFIAIDDLNDWVGCLGGHPQVKTPNIDRLAQRGIVFTNTHCAAPLCNPSRAAVFSGRHPFETGVLANDKSDIRKIQSDLVLIPQHFKSAGYRTFGSGKLLHQTAINLFDEDFFPECRWSPFTPKQVNYLADEVHTKSTSNPRHVTELKGREVVLPLNRMPSDREPTATKGESFDWGSLEIDDLDMGDGQIADWTAKHLARQHDQPFFIATGFYRPHIPLFAPKKYFDMYEGLEIALPIVKSDDLDDLSPIGRTQAIEAVTAGSHATVLKYNQWPMAVKSYLACVSFVDAQIGKLLDALDASPHADNTIVILWSDHGWHLGEKQHWGKWTGWQRSTRVPMMIVPARNASAKTFSIGKSCDAPASLLDLYPTMIDLCQLPPLVGLSGQSLVPQLKNPKQESDRVVLTTFDQGNYSATSARWHYIRYDDDSEELYDREADPNEWTNLASNPKFADQIKSLSQHLPDASVYTNHDVTSPAKPKKKR